MNTIEINEWIKRVGELLDSIKSEYASIEAHKVTIMFNLYNDRLLPRESGRSCGACRQRVYRRLKDEYIKLVNQNK